MLHSLPEQFVPSAEETPEEYREPSMAFIAAVDGRGVVLEHIGHSLYCEIDAVGRDIGDLGLDEAPDGVSIWVGTYQGMRDGDEYVAYPVGEFRRLTPEEFERLSIGAPVLVYE